MGAEEPLAEIHRTLGRLETMQPDVERLRGKEQVVDAAVNDVGELKRKARLVERMLWAAGAIIVVLGIGGSYIGVRLATINESVGSLSDWSEKIAESVREGQAEVVGSAQPAAREAVAASFPVATVMAYAGGITEVVREQLHDKGWLVCDGIEYFLGDEDFVVNGDKLLQDLHDVLVETYPSKNGEGWFQVPDLRERFPIGLAVDGEASTLGHSGGSFDHVHEYSEVIKHAHTVDPPMTGTDKDGTHQHELNIHQYVKEVGGPNFEPAGEEEGAERGKATTGDSTHRHSFNIGEFESSPTGNEIGTTATANPPFLVVNYLIRY